MRISDWSSDVCSSDLLDMDAAAVGALCPVDGEEAAHLGQDALERARLVAAVGLDDIAVHRVAGPDDRVPRCLYRAHQRRQMRFDPVVAIARSEEHTSELQSLMRISYAVFCLKKKNKIKDKAVTLI